MFNVLDRVSPLQGIATVPEALWVLSFGIYLIVKGFRPSPILTVVDTGPVARAAGTQLLVARADSSVRRGRQPG